MRDPFNTDEMSDEEIEKFDQELEGFLGLIESGDCDSVRQMLDSDSRWLHAYDCPLSRVTTEEMTTLLLQYGADPNAKGFEGRAALHFAAFEGTPEVVPALIAAGAALEALDDRGCTPLDYSSRDPWGVEITQMLLEAGARYTITAAASLGDIEGVKRILEEDPQAIAKVPWLEWLFTAPLVSANCPDDSRAPIMRLLLEHYDWGKAFLHNQADSWARQGQPDVAKLCEEFVHKSEVP